MPDSPASVLAVLFAIGAAAWWMSLAAAIDHRHRSMLGWSGLALATSLQPATCAPLIIALLIGRRVSPRLWLAAPLTFFPAIAAIRFAGWPLPDLSGVYVGQADWSPMLANNAPNAWSIVQALPWIGDLPLTGLALASAVGATVWLTARFAWRSPEGSDVIPAALLFALVLPGLLPGSDARSFVMADVLALGLAAMRGDRRSWTICALVESGSMLALVGDLSGIRAGAIAGAVPMIVATVLIARRFLVSPANDNGLPLNPFRAYPA